ncbi:MAG: PAS-domain containing protein [Alphaproteobacteria bacterium]|nr:PAS-domain containing protein [Alphaproteobacteria bacterium]
MSAAAPEIDAATAAAALDEVTDAVALVGADERLRWANAAWRRAAGDADVPATIARLETHPTMIVRRVAVADGTLLVAGDGDASLFREVLDSIDSTIAVYDREERYRFGNAAYHRLYPHHPPDGALIGKTFEAMLRATLEARFFAEPQAANDPEGFVDRRVAEFREVPQGDSERMSTLGRWDLLRTRFTPSGLRISMRTEITEQKRIQEALRLAKEQLEADAASRARFVARLSRELRAPLSAVLGYAEMIEGEYAGPVGTPKYREYASLVLQAGRRLLDLVESLAEYGRDDGEHHAMHEETVDLVGLLRREMVAMEGPARQSRIQLVLDLMETSPALHGDERMVRQMVVNLLSNAVRFAADGIVTLSLRLDAAGGIAIQVRDTGVGMAAEVLARAGEPYYRGPLPPGGGEPGTGLGLAIVRDLMTLHGGRLTLASEPGRGTLASLSFPPERTR